MATRSTSPRRGKAGQKLDAMSSYATGFNTTPGPLVIDRAGRSLGGGEWGALRPDEQPAKGLIADGQILLVERPEGVADEDLAPGALAAFEATAAENAETKEG